jgi:hypothetical protein
VGRIKAPWTCADRCAECATAKLNSGLMKSTLDGLADRDLWTRHADHNNPTMRPGVVVKCAENSQVLDTLEVAFFWCELPAATCRNDLVQSTMRRFG